MWKLIGYEEGGRKRTLERLTDFTMSDFIIKIWHHAKGTDFDKVISFRHLGLTCPYRSWLLGPEAQGWPELEMCIWDQHRDFS